MAGQHGSCNANDNDADLPQCCSLGVDGQYRTLTIMSKSLNIFDFCSVVQRFPI